MNIRAAVLSSAVFILCQCGYGYSDGDRTGVIVKFSYKGLFWKSWEGTLNLGSVSDDGHGGMVANTWDFHVNRQDVVDQVQAALKSGKPVTMHYTQWAISPCSQNSDYDVASVTVKP